MKLTGKQVDIIRLIMRSRSLDDGWRKVSDPVWPLIEGAHMPEDLVEVRRSDGERFVRLTPNGVVVATYLI